MVMCWFQRALFECVRDSINFVKLLLAVHCRTRPNRWFKFLLSERDVRGVALRLYRALVITFNSREGRQAFAAIMGGTWC
jgi:hypothetical protein